MKRIYLLACVAILVQASVIAHEGDPPHELVDRLAGTWQRDAVPSNRLGPESFVADDFETVAFQQHHSLDEWEYLFNRETDSGHLLHVGACRALKNQRILFALRISDGIYEFGISSSRSPEERWRPIQLVRASDSESDILFIGRTAYQRLLP